MLRIHVQHIIRFQEAAAGVEICVYSGAEEVISQGTLCYFVSRYFSSIGKMQSNTTFHIWFAKRCSYIACINDMFRALYQPSSGCTLSYFKANYTINKVFVSVHEIPSTSIKFALKIITVAVELKSYFNIKGKNSTKSWVL
jgi:hypothetical protein